MWGRGPQSRCPLPTTRAGLGDGEHALALGLDAATLATGADRWGGAGLGTRAAAGGTGLVHGYLQRHLLPCYGLVKGDGHLRLQVRSLLGPRFRAPPPAAG